MEKRDTPQPGYEPVVEFGGRIPQSLHRRFVDQFPQRGAVVWFINEMLNNFLTVVEANPSYKEQMNAAIARAAGDNRTTGQ